MTERFAKKLLVIITEAALEKPLVELARRAGAHGHTVHDVRGSGQFGEREGNWEADRSIELKIVCSEPVASQIAAEAMTRYAANFGLTMFFADVDVLRPDKY